MLITLIVLLFLICVYIILRVYILTKELIGINKSIEDISENIGMLHNNQNIMQKSILRIYNETKLFKKESHNRK